MPSLVKAPAPFRQTQFEPSSISSSRPIMAAGMNTWEEQALMVLWCIPPFPVPSLTKCQHTTRGHPPNPKIFDPLIYPGLYSSSGIDILTILVRLPRFIPCIYSLYAPFRPLTNPNRLVFPGLSPHLALLPSRIVFVPSFIYQLLNHGPLTPFFSSHTGSNPHPPEPYHSPRRS